MNLIRKIAARFSTGPDKILHALVSGALVLGIFFGLLLIGVSGLKANGFALLITLLIGAGKEIADRYTGGTPSSADMTANVVGALPVALLIYLFRVVLPELIASFS